MNNSLEEALLKGTSPQTQEFYHHYIHHLDRWIFPDDIFDYIQSAYGALKNRESFKTIKTYCTFIGATRSGHSLIAALMDAHPEMVISDELHAIRYLKYGFSQQQNYSLILQMSQINAQKDREMGGYSYGIYNQWQGQFKELKVIGDKDGPGAALRLYLNPNLFKHLCTKSKPSSQFIHVIRNPYDSITTLMKKTNLLKEESLDLKDPFYRYLNETTLDLETTIELYFLLYKAVARLKEKLDPSNCLDIHHESFLENPKNSLIEICDFLGVDSPSDYLKDCSEFVYKSPHKSRHGAEWTPKLIDLVRRNMELYPFFSHYSYQD